LVSTHYYSGNNQQKDIHSNAAVNIFQDFLLLVIFINRVENNYELNRCISAMKLQHRGCGNSNEIFEWLKIKHFLR
jgi:hypothetical protein